jgi:hypothetical protein
VQEPVDLRTVRARVELTVAAGDGDEVMPSGGLSIYESLAQMVGDLRLCFDNAVRLFQHMCCEFCDGKLIFWLLLDYGFAAIILPADTCATPVGD